MIYELQRDITYAVPRTAIERASTYSCVSANKIGDTLVNTVAMLVIVFSIAVKLK